MIQTMASVNADAFVRPAGELKLQQTWLHLFACAHLFTCLLIPSCFLITVRRRAGARFVERPCVCLQSFPQSEGFGTRSCSMLVWGERWQVPWQNINYTKSARNADLQISLYVLRHLLFVVVVLLRNVLEDRRSSTGVCFLCTKVWLWLVF